MNQQAIWKLNVMEEPDPKKEVFRVTVQCNLVEYWGY